jgi:hypothetical protein
MIIRPLPYSALPAQAPTVDHGLPWSLGSRGAGYVPNQTARTVGGNYLPVRSVF